MMESEALKIAIANTLVDKLWLKGLLTEEERAKICELNAQKILSKK